MLTKCCLTSAVGLCGYFVGKWVEKHQSSNIMKDLPCLPVFGTVSAAVPIESNALQQYVSPSDTVTNRMGQIMKYGFPGLDNVKPFQDYVLSYDQRNRVAHWVFEHLTKESIAKNKDIDRSKCDFKEDKSIHTFFRSLNEDYRKSGYDRGHLAAAGNHRLCQAHVDETFYLSNIAPQVGVGFNRDTWNDLEQYVRKLARTHENVYVCTGPLYLPRKEEDGKTYVKYQVIGANHVAVPTHFFKMVVMETSGKELELEAYVMPNKQIEKGIPLHFFQVPPESIERASGLLFFNKLSRQKLKRINGGKA